jgi:hypothetical protein
MIVFSAKFFQPFYSKMIDTMPLKVHVYDIIPYYSVDPYKVDFSNWGGGVILSVLYSLGTARVYFSSFLTLN